MTTKLPPIKKIDNIVCFEQQPDDTSQATWNNFITNDNKIILNKPYLIHSEINPRIWEAHRTKPGFQHANDFKMFLKKGRIYIFKKK